MRNFKEYKSSKEVLAEVCPVADLFHNCMYSGMTDRMNKIMNREWVSTDANCVPYSPRDMLKLLTNSASLNNLDILSPHEL